MQADIVILTNDNPRDVPPEDIVADTVAGYAELVLKHNVLECSPTSPGFLQDPGRVEWTSLPFYWDACYQCASGTANARVCLLLRTLRHAEQWCPAGCCFCMHLPVCSPQVLLWVHCLASIGCHRLMLLGFIHSIKSLHERWCHASSMLHACLGLPDFLESCI